MKRRSYQCYEVWQDYGQEHQKLLERVTGDLEKAEWQAARWAREAKGAKVFVVHTQVITTYQLEVTDFHFSTPPFPPGVEESIKMMEDARRQIEETTGVRYASNAPLPHVKPKHEGTIDNDPPA